MLPKMDLHFITKLTQRLVKTKPMQNFYMVINEEISNNDSNLRKIKLSKSNIMTHNINK